MQLNQNWGTFTADYTPPFIIPTHEGEYEARNSVLVDGGERFGVSAVVFDKHEELIWMGNQGVCMSCHMRYGCYIFLI